MVTHLSRNRKAIASRVTLCDMVGFGDIAKLKDMADKSTRGMGQFKRSNGGHLTKFGKEMVLSMEQAGYAGKGISRGGFIVDASEEGWQYAADVVGGNPWHQLDDGQVIQYGKIRQSENPLTNNYYHVLQGVFDMAEGDRDLERLIALLHTTVRFKTTFDEAQGNYDTGPTTRTLWTKARPWVQFIRKKEKQAGFMPILLKDAGHYDRIKHIIVKPSDVIHLSGKRAGDVKQSWIDDLERRRKNASRRNNSRSNKSRTNRKAEGEKASKVARVNRRDVTLKRNEEGRSYENVSAKHSRDIAPVTRKGFTK